MALTAPDRAKVEEYIIGFLEGDFLDTLTRYYAEGVAYSSTHPQNINNELRNAITHMARSLRADDYPVAEKELAAAARHVERFKRDCLKVAVVFAGENTGDLLKYIQRNFDRIDPALSLEASRIVRERTKALLSEAAGDEETVLKWETIFRDIALLRERIIDLYPSLNPAKQKLPLWVYRWWSAFKSITAALTLAIIAGIILIALFPDPQSSGNAIRKAVADAIEPANPSEPKIKLTVVATSHGNK